MNSKSAQDEVRTAGRGGLALSFAKIYFMVLGLAQQIVLSWLLQDSYGALRGALSPASIAYNAAVTASVFGMSRAVSRADVRDRPHVIRVGLSIQTGVGLALGTAFFLGATPLVELCHAAEEALGAARSGAIELQPRLFDAAQRSLDWLQGMVDAIERQEDLEPTSAELIAAFELEPAAVAPPAASLSKASPAATGPAAANADDPISDDEFESLLDQLHGDAPPGSQPDPGATATTLPCRPPRGGQASAAGTQGARREHHAGGGRSRTDGPGQHPPAGRHGRPGRRTGALAQPPEDAAHAAAR